MTAPTIGARVKFGFRYGYILDIRGTNALVTPERLQAGDGYLPHEVPLRDLIAAPLTSQDSAA